MRNILSDTSLYIKSSYIPHILHIGKDIIFLYKNFLHWNISKLLIALSSFFVGLILASPFIIILIILIFLDGITWSELIANMIGTGSDGFDPISVFLHNPLFIFFEGIFFILAFLSIILGYSYGIYLKSRLYISYHLREKLSFSENDYFSRAHIKKFIQIFGLIFLYACIPTLICIIGAICLYTLFILDIVSFRLFSEIRSIYFILVFCILFYLVFRVIFSYIEYASLKDVSVSAKIYVQKSFEKTRGYMLLSFLSVFFVFGIMYSPFEYIDGKIQSEGEALKDYARYTSTPTDQITIEEQSDFEYLQEKYKNISGDALIVKQEKQSWITFVYGIFLLMCIEGVSFQVLVSYYFLFSTEKKTQKKNLFFNWNKGEF